MALKMAGKKKLKYKYKVKSPQKPEVVVGGVSGQKTPLVDISQVKPARRLSKGKLLGVLAVVLVAGIALTAHISHNRAIAQQRSDLVTQAAALMSPEDTSQLASVVAQIKQEPGYAKDADCLYVLTTYYINIGDPANVKTYYDKLVAVYDTKKGYSNPHLKDAVTPDALQGTITFYENQTTQAQQNSNNISPEYKQ